MTTEERLAELERRVVLLVRLSRLNIVAMPDEAVRGYIEDFQALTRQVEKENPTPGAPLSGPVEFTMGEYKLPPYEADPNGKN